MLNPARRPQDALRQRRDGVNPARQRRGGVNCQVKQAGEKMNKEQLTKTFGGIVVILSGVFLLFGEFLHSSEQQ